jgi:hypothetical protein
MDGYYDHGPLVLVERPVVVTSPLREFTRAVAYRTASLLGLPFHDIDRLVEHQAGKTIEQLVLEEGEGAYRSAEAKCLATALEQRLGGIIALADQDTAWLGTGGSRERSDCILVILDFELPNLYWRIQTTARDRQTSHWHPLFEGMPQSVSDIRPFWSTWRSAQPESGLRLSADTWTVAQTSQWLQDWIQGGSE